MAQWYRKGSPELPKLDEKKITKKATFFQKWFAFLPTPPEMVSKICKRQEWTRRDATRALALAWEHFG